MASLWQFFPLKGPDPSSHPSICWDVCIAWCTEPWCWCWDHIVRGDPALNAGQRATAQRRSLCTASLQHFEFQSTILSLMFSQSVAAVRDPDAAASAPARCCQHDRWRFVAIHCEQVQQLQSQRGFEKVASDAWPTLRDPWNSMRYDTGVQTACTSTLRPQ